MAKDRLNRLGFLLCLLLFLGGELRAECVASLTDGLPCISEAWELVGQEHLDRIDRLNRLSEDDVAFRFSTDVVTQEEHGLQAFPADIPVLRVVADQDIFFDTGSDTIRPEALKLLDIIADSLKREPPDVSLFVAGHTDARGSDDYNMDLGLRRAQSVAAALVRRGIYQAEIFRLSFGEATPIASNDTVAGRARNRRVEFLFAAKTAAIVTVLERQHVEVCAEKYQDEFGRCRLPITFEATRVEVPVSAQSEVVLLDEQIRAIEDDNRLTSVEVEEHRQEIEVRRERIPIQFAPVKIPITIIPE